MLTSPTNLIAFTVFFSISRVLSYYSPLLCKNVCQRFICPCDGSSTFGRLLSGAGLSGGFETKHGEKNIVVLALLCWLFMERIHPSFCALRAGAMRVGILGSEGSKPGNNSAPQTCRWTARTASASGFFFRNTVLQSALMHTHTHTHTRLNMHTQKINKIVRGIPDLCLHLRSYYSPFCLRDMRLSAK